MLAVEKSSGKENSSLPLSALWPVTDLRKTDLFGRDRWLLSMEEGPHWCEILIETAFGGKPWASAKLS